MSPLLPKFLILCNWLSFQSPFFNYNSFEPIAFGKHFCVSIFPTFLFPAFRNCAEIFKSGEKRDGVYFIKPDNQSAFDAFCDQTTAGGGWTVFQKRIDGSVDFKLNWSDYKHGFENLRGEFWLGLDRIHRLTSDNNSILRVAMDDFEGKTAYAEYSFFVIRSAQKKYQLILGSYNTSGD